MHSVLITKKSHSLRVLCGELKFGFLLDFKHTIFVVKSSGFPLVNLEVIGTQLGIQLPAFEFHLPFQHGTIAGGGGE